MQFSVPILTSSRAPIITGTVVVFIPHVFSISISRSSQDFVSFSTVFKKVFLSVGMDISMSRHFLFFWFIIIIIDYHFYHFTSGSRRQPYQWK